MITIYRDGRWYGRKKNKNEVQGHIKGELLEQVFSLVDNTLDKAEEKAFELLQYAPDEVVAENKDLIPAYEVVKEYTKNDLFVYNNKVFRVIQTHTSNKSWNPEKTPAIYQDLSNTLDEEGNEVINEWKQPTGGHDLYSKGDKVIYKDKTWELVGKDTGHAPGLVAGVWEVID